MSLIQEVKKGKLVIQLGEPYFQSSLPPQMSNTTSIFLVILYHLHINKNIYMSQGNWYNI